MRSLTACAGLAAKSRRRQTKSDSRLSSITSEHVDRVERRQARKRGEFVGFVGCPKAGLLKVRIAAERRASMRVACPRCGEAHTTTQPMGRPMRPGEVVTLVAEGVPMEVGDTPDEDTPLSDEAAPDAEPPRPRL